MSDQVADQDRAPTAGQADTAAEVKPGAGAAVLDPDKDTETLDGLLKEQTFEVEGGFASVSNPYPIDKDSIHRRIRSNSNRIRHCYESQLSDNPDLSGKMIARFTIVVDGTVGDIAATGMHEGVARCVAAVIKTIRFPSFEGEREVKVNYPFVFPSIDRDNDDRTVATDSAVLGDMAGIAGLGAGGDKGVGGGPRGRSISASQIRVGDSTAVGDLDKDVIRRYIRRKLPRIKDCYEKVLLVTPGLEGLVTVKFQISPIGEVLTAEAEGLHKEVASCVADTIKTIRFPQPKGGGLVDVTYPFTFKAEGG